MKVFKFGGASVKDAASVKNVSFILNIFKSEKISVVVSAMGKTTNALEKLTDSFVNRDFHSFQSQIEEIKEFHFQLINDLFGQKGDMLISNIDFIFNELTEKFYLENQKSVAYVYDQIVSLGEVISTQIVAEFLVLEGHNAKWCDARKFIRTNHRFREAEIDWSATQELINTNFLPDFDRYDVQITQGFIGHTSDHSTTTLGREGSDFSAGVLAFCTNAESVTIWKDVPGMLNADPKYFENTIKLSQISFREAIELSYYGASVIHPKTIKPLQNKNIPLYVKSFIEPKEPGTVIQSEGDEDHLVPSFIFKHKQVLISFTPKDFSFIVEQNLSDIFMRLSRGNAKINLMQNTALNFFVLLDEDKIDLLQLLGLFENDYSLQVSQNLELVTVRHYDQETLELVTKNKSILVEQKTTQTARLVLQNKNNVIAPTI